MTFDKARTYGFTGTVFICLLTFLVLWLVLLPIPIQKLETEDGIMVSFGEDMNGGGFGDGGGMGDNMYTNNAPGTTPAIPIKTGETTPAVTESKTKLKSSSEEVLTQNYEESVALATQKKKAIQDKENKKAQDLLIQQQEQQRKAAAAEQQRKQQAIAKANDLMGGSFGNGTGTGRGDGSGSGSYGTGSGNGSGSGTADARQGNPAGRGSAGGHGWSLTGRSLAGSLVMPGYPSNVEGKVIVNIRVDANGNVTSATVGQATNISDPQTRNAALTAARKTHFTAGKGIVLGSITYNFKLK